MAYIVLALGAFLSIGGALSIFHGAGIVEIERGWTGVIAGATSLTGGIVTIALGLILKTLLDLRSNLAARPMAPAFPSDVVAPHHFEDRANQGPSLAPAAGEPTSLMTTELESGMLAAILSPTEAAAELERPFGAPAGRTGLRSLPTAGVFEPPQHGREALSDEKAPADLATEIEAVESLTLEHEPVAEKSRFRINFKGRPPEPAAVVAAEPAVPMDDWLDRAFSALDNEPPRHPAARATDFDEDAHAPAEDALANTEPVSAVTEDMPAGDAVLELHEPSSPQPALPAAASSVIGRYEADGTSYVMYADGSIEAQSDAGVHRFNSMTELKAFIESADA